MTGTPTPIPGHPSGSMHTPRSTAAIVAGPAVAWRQALWLIAAATFARLMLGAIVPLLPDEAYYWDWSQHLAFGYFDHPPLIAWLIAGGTAVFGDTNIGVRFLPIVLAAIASLAVAASARRLAGDIAARFAALVLAVMPLSAVGFVLATPDAPLLACIALTLFALVHAMAPGATRRESTRAWLGAGAAIGLAMASKFTGVFIPIAATVGILLHREARAQLRRPGPYLAVAVASLVMLPVLWWNAQHEWIAFRFQLGHGLGVTTRGSWWQRELDLLGGQLALVSPILLGAFLRATARAADRQGEARRFVFATMVLCCLAFFVFSATRKSVEANWPAIAWVPALVLAAAARPMLRTAWERRAIWLAGAITLVALSQVLVAWWPVAARRDPVARAHGWQHVAASVDSLVAVERASDAPVFVAANRYQDAALLRFHRAGRPESFALNLRSARRNQYDLWPTLPTRAAVGATLLFVLDERSDPAGELPPAVSDLAPHFASAEMGPRLSLRRGSSEYAARRVWILRAWQGSWPSDSSALAIVR